jgi:hypothetical protein
MHKEILTSNQKALLPLVKMFRKDFYLVGGTAIALQIGHRTSIDFDLFTNADSLNIRQIKARYREVQFPGKRILYEAFDQFHIMINDVKIKFFAFPYPVKAAILYDSFCSMPNLLTLAAMKVYALGGRAKWKDYVDLYYILKSHHTLDQISRRAENVFGDMFSAKLLRQQLSYFEDIDYSEEVEYIAPEASQDEIKKFLIKIATEKI